MRTWSGNIGMIKVAEKLGFTKEAVFRMARIVEGEYFDGLGYGILRTEWEERYARDFAMYL
jgi:putative hydrolase of HD superfamily